SGAHRLDMTPQGTEDIVAELPQALEPGALGQGGQEPRGHMLVPSPCAGQRMGTAAPKERGKHEAEDFPEALLLSAQATFDLEDEVIREAHVVEGLVQGVDIALSLALLVLMACFRMQATAVNGFGVLSDVAFGS